MLSVHATDGVQVLLAGFLDKISKVFPKQQAEINGNGRQTPGPGEPKGLGVWPCYNSWLGCAPWVCVFGLGFRLHPATPGWAVGVCVCWYGRSTCTFPLLAGVRAVGVCVWARVSAARRDSWLGC